LYLEQLLLDPFAGGIDRIAHRDQLFQRRVDPMLLQPQALAQHFMHGVAHRIFVAADNGLDLDASGAQALLQCVGGVQHLGHGAAAVAAPLPQMQGETRNGDGKQQQQDVDQAGDPGGRKAQSAVGPGVGQTPRFGQGFGLTERAPGPNISRLMSTRSPEPRVPEVLDAWRMVAARRDFEGSLPLSSLSRLRDSLCDDGSCDGGGEVRFALQFDCDALQVPYVELRIDAALPLECQRTLQRFLQPVHLVQRLGLIRGEADEAGLPEGYEPLLMPEDGMLRPAELVEDELILAVPVVPTMPGTEAMERDWPVQAEEQARANPFAALGRLKHKD
jgi:uncharacterized protein